MRRNVLSLCVVLLLCAGLVWAAVHTQTQSTVPGNDANFLTHLQTLLRSEDALRYQDQFASFVVTGLTGSAGVSLAHTIAAGEGYVQGFYVSVPGTLHTYTANRRTYVYVDWFDTRTGQATPLSEVSFSGGTGCTFQSRSTRLIFAECSAGSTDPTPSVGVMPILVVDTNAIDITAVYSIKNTLPQALSTVHGAINVLEYGVKNDGTTRTDFHMNRVSTLVGAARRTLHFPAGIYLICNPVFYNSLQRWQFDRGAIVKLDNGCVQNLISTHLVFATTSGMFQPIATGVTDVEFIGLSLDGNKANNPTANSGSGLDIFNVSGMLVKDFTAVGIPRDGITTAMAASNIRIDGWFIFGTGLVGVNGSNCIAIVQGNGVIVRNGICDTVVAGGGASGAGIDIEPNAGDAANVVTDVILSHNIVRNAGDAAILVLNPNTGAQQVNGLVISDNILMSSLYGLRVNPLGSAARFLGLTARGNVARSNLRHGFYLVKVESATMADNVAFENSQEAADTYSGFFIDGNNNMLSGNIAGSTGDHKYGFEEEVGADRNIFMSSQAGGSVSADYQILGVNSVRMSVGSGQTTKWGATAGIFTGPLSLVNPGTDSIFMIDGAVANEVGLFLRHTGVTKWRIETNADTNLKFHNNVSIQMQVAGTDPGDGGTALLIRRNVGGTLSLEQVTMDAVDTCGAGFRCLRMPN